MKVSYFLMMLNICWALLGVNHYIRGLMWEPLAILLVAQIITTIAIIKYEQSKF